MNRSAISNKTGRSKYLAVNVINEEVGKTNESSIEFDHESLQTKREAFAKRLASMRQRDW